MFPKGEVEYLQAEINVSWYNKRRIPDGQFHRGLFIVLKVPF